MFIKKLDIFFIRSGTRKCSLLSTLLFNIILEILAKATRQKKYKNILRIKSKNWMLLFLFFVIVYVENPKAPTKIISLTLKANNWG